MASFAMVNIAVICHFYLREQRRSPAITIEYLVLPLLGAVLSLYFLFHLPPRAKLLGFLWLGLGALYLTVITRGFRRPPPGLKLE